MKLSHWQIFKNSEFDRVLPALMVVNLKKETAIYFTIEMSLLRINGELQFATRNL